MEKLNRTEARQSENRRTNRTALIWGTLGIIVAFVVLFLLFAPGRDNVIDAPAAGSTQQTTQ